MCFCGHLPVLNSFTEHSATVLHYLPVAQVCVPSPKAEGESHLHLLGVLGDERKLGKGGKEWKSRQCCPWVSALRYGPPQADRLQEQTCKRLIRCQSRRAHSEGENGLKWWTMTGAEGKEMICTFPSRTCTIRPDAVVSLSPYHFHTVAYWWASSGSQDLIYHSGNWLTDISKNLQLLYKINSSFLPAEI